MSTAGFVEMTTLRETQNRGESNRMTPDQINAKCAEVMGFYDFQYRREDHNWNDLANRDVLVARLKGDGNYLQPVPNFAGSHDAAMQFAEHLQKEKGILTGMINFKSGEWQVVMLEHAAIGPDFPALICEVGLRTINLWEEETK